MKNLENAFSVRKLNTCEMKKLNGGVIIWGLAAGMLSATGPIALMASIVGVIGMTLGGLICLALKNKNSSHRQ